MGIITNGHFSVRLFILYERSLRCIQFIYQSAATLCVGHLNRTLLKTEVLLYTSQVQRNKLKACKADLLFDTILVGGGKLESKVPSFSSPF